MSSIPLLSPVKPANLTKRDVPSACAEFITLKTPLCLQQLYGIPATPATQPGNILGVSGFNNEFANQVDLQVCCIDFSDCFV